jgi:hypothetical protein
MTATIKIFERVLKVGEWVEIDPHKHRPSYLIRGTAWRVESFNVLKQTCQVTNEKTGSWHRSETLDFEEVSDSSPFKKTDIVQLKKDSRYIGRVIMCRGNKIKIQWAKGLAESLDSDKIKLFIQMVKGEQIPLGNYAFQKGDHVKTTDKNFGNVILTVKECLPSGMVMLSSSNDPNLLLPGCGLTIVEEGF